MSERNHYVVTTTLPPEFGGRTKSLLQRTKFLTETFTEPFTLISTNYHPNYNEIYQSYIEKKYVPSNTRFLNIYDFFANRTYQYKKSKNHPVHMKKHSVQEVAPNQIYRYYIHGSYVRYRKYDEINGCLLFEDMMDPHTAIRKERLLYNRFGYCHKKIIFKCGTTHILEEIFYDDRGKAYVTKAFNGEANKELVRINLHYQGEIIEFKTERDFFAFAFNLILTDNAVTFCDARLLDKPLLECKIHTKKIFVLHSSHTINGKLRASYQYLLKHHQKADSIIVLTHEQADDLVQAGMNRSKITVIPHTIKAPQYLKDTPRANEIVFIGRLAEEKQIHHIIQAFHLIAKDHPEWTLALYGNGDQQTDLQGLTETLSLDNQVQFKGFTAKPDEAFQQAACSVITSKFEGFGLVILESLHHGCPVIAYDFKYGPKDLITHGLNGLIVDQNNIELLAQAMQKIIKQPLPHPKLAEAFYLEHNMPKWKQIMNV